jgi:SnoaL-like domain
MSPSDPAAIADRLDIIELISKLSINLDARDWSAVRGLFTDVVYSDRTSLFGGEPVTLGADEFVEGWRQSLDNLDAVNHLVANHVITLEGDKAKCAANMQGVHVFHNPSGDDMWNVGGRHDYQLERTADGWLIAGLTFTISWATGNMNIVNLAAAAG